MKTKNALPIFMLILSLSGFAFFYLFPFAFSIIFALTDNPLRFQFIGLKNFFDLFQNKYFMNGLSNTVFFMAVSIPLNLILSLMLALLLSRNRYSRVFSLVFMLPLVIPSSTTAFFWGKLYGDAIQGDHAMFIMISIFLWKNIGYNMALFTGGLYGIEDSYYECADMEGASVLQKFRFVTAPFLTPVFFLALIMTFVNSFKIFKEIYLMTGEYPAENIYVLQHFMNNMFLSLQYPRLVSAVYLLTGAVTLLIGLLFITQRKIVRNLEV